MPETTLFDSAGVAYQKARVAHWDAIAQRRDSWRGWAGAYHRRLEEVFRFHIGPGQRVLELGCSVGDLLAAVRPAHGVGVDFSGEMICRACEKYPELEFLQADVHAIESIEGPFDTIILSDLVNDLWDVQRVLQGLRRLCLPSTRLMLNFQSGLWQLPLTIAQALKVATPMLPQNWLTPEDARGMLYLAGFETIRNWQEVLWPFPLGAFPNRFVARFWPFNELTLSNFVIARLSPPESAQDYGVSIVIPARNESGNIQSIFERAPQIGASTELIFVEGHSRDDTYAAIQREIAAHPSRTSRLLKQQGIGKADAVRQGFQEAHGDVLMILDADLTVPPEELPRFYDALRTGKGEFINGVRLVYPMEREAMQGLNFLGNKLLSMAFSWLLGQPIKDTLCGTKVLWRKDYALIAANRAYFGEFDPFGDYDLIFGAAKLNRKIVDLPVRYRERTYGATNISRWRHGLLLLRMLIVAARRLKFV